VLAVECIFHFPSRARFFAEASRVLVEGGRMALSDFVPTEKSLPLLQYFNSTTEEAVRRTYGQVDFLCTVKSYQQLASAAGMEVEKEDDINAHTLPTYAFLRQNLRTWPNPDEAAVFDRATAQIEMVCRAQLLHYTVLSFQKPTSRARKQSA
jgi:cyclopropane fatty-acyl-phospholipid synthase-like methyltransferase